MNELEIKKEENKKPSPLPIGMQEFDDWALDIITTYDLPNNDSIKFAMATMILHMGPKEAFVPKHDIFLMIRASMAKQIAGAQFQAIKERQKAEQEALAKAAAEDAAKLENKQ